MHLLILNSYCTRQSIFALLRQAFLSVAGIQILCKETNWNRTKSFGADVSHKFKTAFPRKCTYCAPARLFFFERAGTEDFRAFGSRLARTRSAEREAETLQLQKLSCSQVVYHLHCKAAIFFFGYKWPRRDFSLARWLMAARLLGQVAICLQWYFLQTSRKWMPGR